MRNIDEGYARVWIKADGTVSTSYQEVAAIKCPLDVTDFPFGRPPLCPPRTCF